MMKKTAVCLLLTLCLAVIGLEPFRAAGAAFLAQIRASAPAEDGDAEAAETVPAASGETREAVLYYRFGDTAMLGCAFTTIDLRSEKTVATTIVERLIEGPDGDHSRLQGLFPSGTRLVSAVSDGTTVYVTLNHAFLDRPDEAPSNWEDDPVWQAEAALRRKMALQSIVLSLSEEGEAQRVQIFVAEADDEIGQRLQMAWFEPEEQDPQLFLGPCGRDENIALTARRALALLMSAWQQHDWETVYLLLDRSGGELPGLETFREEMEERAVELLSFSISDGMVSRDGQRATMVADAVLRTGDGETAQVVRESVLLRRDEDNWAMGQETLRQLMIRE